ncbi:MAG: [FeFe] hydrogenase H-cluster maturation GTPase HydF [Bacteroidales bacterium]|jgi:[FeFe] hydrogenase H-cluster maturation GTPase HydF|nr:[FeFe] hydrogenase H-cluster maturation GTPase HydF [Bacteroidales bacterium]
MAKGRDLKPHIGIFGRRNNGKSSLINLITNQEVAIVSDSPGTTTDPVKKSIEISGIGPAIIVDTAGIDDTGELGEKRIKKTYDAIKTIDCAILVITQNKFGSYEKELIKQFRDYSIPYFIVHNKADIMPLEALTVEKIKDFSKAEVIDFSVLGKANADELITLLKKTIPETTYQKPSLLGGVIKPNGVILLVTPIDSAAPDGRMILPQVMSIRDVLDNDNICIVLKEIHLQQYFDQHSPEPQLVITDSQAFDFVNKIVPAHIPLTSFSIVFARLKGDFEQYMQGTPTLSELNDGDKILILESCSHHVSCEDIGRQKLPAWISKFSGKQLEFDVVAGLSDIPKINNYKMVIQCGGCVVTRKQLLNRLRPAVDANIAVSNYGMSIAWINGIFDRVIAPFKNIAHND